MVIVDKEKILDGHLKVFKYFVTENGIVFEREFVDVGDTVCALVYNTITKKYIFVKQFRPGVASSNLIELPGGLVDNYIIDLEDTIKKEIVEEIGYKTDNIEKLISTYFVPGYSSERIHIYYIEVSEKISEGGGVESEDEFIEIVEMTKEEISEFDFENLSDAKTILSLMKLKLI